MKPFDINPQINGWCTLVTTNVKIHSRCNMSVSEWGNGGSVDSLKSCGCRWKMTCTVNLNQEVYSKSRRRLTHREHEVSSPSIPGFET